MLLSMTGFGEAHRQAAGLTIAAEVRTINGRYFKHSLRISEAYAGLEPEIENLVRGQIRRGTIQVTLRIHRAASADDYRLNAVALASYRQQLESLQTQWGTREPIALDKLLVLPGVVEEVPSAASDVSELWPVVRATLEEALQRLARMRAEEGAAMAGDLRINAATIAERVAQISQRAPLVVDAYRGRLEERLKKLLAEYEITLSPSDLLKEVSIYAERSDISEELVRLRSHLEQFEQMLTVPESSGRKLEFLTQEIYRETNTIGSKSSDVEIARHVIEMKAAVERIREMIQNVE